MSVAAVRTAMATALRTITDGGTPAVKLRATEYVTDKITPPHAMFDYEVQPDLTFARGADVYNFTVWVFAQRAPEVASQKFLDLLRDPTTAGGVKRTLEDDATLAAEVDYVSVKRIGRVEISPVGGIEYLMISFDVEVVL